MSKQYEMKKLLKELVFEPTPEQDEMLVSILLIALDVNEDDFKYATGKTPSEYLAG